MEQIKYQVGDFILLSVDEKCSGCAVGEIIEIHHVPGVIGPAASITQHTEFEVNMLFTICDTFRPHCSPFPVLENEIVKTLSSDEIDVLRVMHS